MESPTRTQGTAETDRESLTAALGGRASAIDASVPPVLFGLAWFVAGKSIAVGSAVAVLAGAVIALWRWRGGARPFAVVVSLLAVMLGAVIALRTGNAVDFFLVRVVSNAASALAWMAGIAIRWPLLGLVVGTVLGQGRRWRRDPALLRAYQWASWAWVGQYAVRLVVFIPLWLTNAVVALGVAQMVLTWPLVAVSVGASWWIVSRTLPADHPGIRHPMLPEESKDTPEADQP